jgi:hypothetical protein
MKNKEPLSFEELGQSDTQPSDAAEAAKRLHASMESKKGELLDDEQFLENLLRRCVDAPDAFVREIKGETSGAEKKIERHSLRGRTNKTKFIVYLSDVESEQLDSLVRHRGDRGPSDLINQLLCTVLKALRSI